MYIWRLLVKVYFWPERRLARSMAASRASTRSLKCNCGSDKPSGELLCDGCRAW